MELSILVIDTRGKENIHSTKRPLMGTKRLKISKELENNIPSNWKRQNTNNMEFGNVSPPTLYRNNVLSKAKQQFVDKQLGINKSNVIESLIEIKHNSQAGSIHSVGCYPLFVNYWTNHQLLIYKDMNKAYCRLSIDATGSLVKKIQRTSLNLLSADIFLYEAVVNEGFGQFPVAQMISEKHDTTTIAYWLDMWLKSGISAPNETITDYSKALLGAISRSFCMSNLRAYVIKCFMVITQQSNENSKPPCFIRIDVVHIIKLFCSLKSLKGPRNKRLKEFYVRGFRLLITSTNLDDFRKILKSMMTVMLSMADG